MHVCMLGSVHEIYISGVGNGDGSDLSMEIRVDGLLIYECRFGDNMNCQVR